MDQFQTNHEEVKETKKSSWKSVSSPFIITLLMAVAFSFGLVTSVLISDEPKSSEEVLRETQNELADIFGENEEINVELFTEVWDLVHNEYLDKNNINDVDLFYGALGGMIAALGDPHTVFLTPQITEDFTQELEGSFFGIGAEIGKKNGNIVVVAPLPDTPADRVGLKTGDKILAVDDKDVSGLSVTQAVHLIRGEKGEPVVLTILTKEDDIAKDVTIIREKIDIPSVVYSLEDDIAVITITHFNNDTPDKFTNVAQKVLRDNPQGVILDLRNNPGGFLNVAVEIASSWLDPEQVVVRETYSDKRNDVNHTAVKRVSLADFDTIVLVNEGSASASEIVAGALQDYDIAKLVGQTTFGKGSVQQLIPLQDNSSIKLTVASWLTPKGRTINNLGIGPDYEIDLSVEDYENDLDPQMDKAKELILE